MNSLDRLSKVQRRALVARRCRSLATARALRRVGLVASYDLESAAAARDRNHPPCDYLLTLSPAGNSAAALVRAEGESP